MPTKRKPKANSNQSIEAKQAKLNSSNSTDDIIDTLEALYGMKMPKDLQHFWTLCLELAPHQPLEAFSFLDWKLVGPFYYIHHGISKTDKPPYFYQMRWRYYYDVPGFFTVITTLNPNKNLFHIGYFCDGPSAVDDCIVVSNSGSNSDLCTLGDNLFSALKSKLDAAGKGASGKVLEKINMVTKKVRAYAEKENLSLVMKSDIVNRRRKKDVATTFHKAGLVVPIVDGVGYRELPHDNPTLKRLLKKVEESATDDDRLKAFEPIQEMVTFIQFANDECDYGMGLELGLDLFCNGSRYFFKMSEMLLTMAYELFKMDLFAEITRAHLADRRKENFSRDDLCK